METIKTYTRVSAEKGCGITAGEKKAVLALVNANNADYFGKWMKGGRINLMVEVLGENNYKASFKLYQSRLDYFTEYSYLVKIS